MRYGRGLLDRIGTPTLIVQGRLDTTALPACATEIYSIIRSVDKELMWFDRSGHMLVTGPEGHHIVQRIVSWVIHHAGPATT
jgi:carboxylesterase